MPIAVADAASQISSHTTSTQTLSVPAAAPVDRSLFVRARVAFLSAAQGGHVLDNRTFCDALDAMDIKGRLPVQEMRPLLDIKPGTTLCFNDFLSALPVVIAGSVFGLFMDDGALSLNDFGSALRRLGFGVDYDEVLTLFAKGDQSGDASMTFEDFNCVLMFLRRTRGVSSAAMLDSLCSVNRFSTLRCIGSESAASTALNRAHSVAGLVTVIRFVKALSVIDTESDVPEKRELRRRLFNFAYRAFTSRIEYRAAGRDGAAVDEMAGRKYCPREASPTSK